MLSSKLLRLPVPLGKYKGKLYSRYTVVLSQSGLSHDLWAQAMSVQVIAESPAAACRAIKAEFASKLNYPTEFECQGARGGVVSRFLGYEGLVMAQMDAVTTDWRQLEMAL